jgi:hypothetical protein
MIVNKQSFDNYICELLPNNSILLLLLLLLLELIICNNDMISYLKILLFELIIWIHVGAIECNIGYIRAKWGYLSLCRINRVYVGVIKMLFKLCNDYVWITYNYI